jgi:hexulose-6-phosphate isomerase
MAMLGIMQGRLLPPIGGCIQCFPRGRWQEEFPLAAQAKLEAIEWIYDAFGAGVNPLETDEGIAEMQRVADAHGVRVVSLCADWFMDFPLVRATPADASQRLDRLCWLLGRCHRAGITRVVLPFVDASKIQDSDDAQAVLSAIDHTLSAAEKAGIELHLETTLPPAAFADLLAKLPCSLVKVNYDSGNSASLGYNVREEFAAYGFRIGSVHLKDRVRGGGTVPLGEGNADFPALFDCLRARRYGGNFILQVARGDSGAELPWARRNLQTARSYIKALDFTQYGPGA